MTKVGIVSLVGSPNAGKSSLLNKIFSRKISIVSDKVQTTRNIIRGIYNDDQHQIIFVDTPGFHKPRNKLQAYMNNQIDEALMQTDVVIYVVDAKYGFGQKEVNNIQRLKEINAPIICLINKVDLITHEQTINLINQAQQMNLFSDIFAISIKNGFNVEHFINDISTYLSEGYPYYDDDQIVDYTTEFYIEELVREKINKYCYAEIPHDVAIKVVNIEDESSLINIYVDIYVRRNSQKSIIIGNNGQNIKKIGKETRLELKQFFQKAVYLDLHVKVKNNWDNNDGLLAEFGYEY